MDKKEVMEIRIRDTEILTAQADRIRAVKPWCHTQEDEAWERLVTATEADDLSGVMTELSTLTALRSVLALHAQKFPETPR